MPFNKVNRLDLSAGSLLEIIPSMLVTATNMHIYRHNKRDDIQNPTII